MASRQRGVVRGDKRKNKGFKDTIRHEAFQHCYHVRFPVMIMATRTWRARNVGIFIHGLRNPAEGPAEPTLRTHGLWYRNMRHEYEAEFSRKTEGKCHLGLGFSGQGAAQMGFMLASENYDLC